MGAGGLKAAFEASELEQSSGLPTIVITLLKNISAWPVGRMPHLKQKVYVYPVKFVSVPVNPKFGLAVRTTSV